MPDPTLSAAIKEAYASANTLEVIYHTLELWHPVFGQPIRIVRDYVNIDARIEAGAARNAGAIVAFTAYAFDVVPPDQSAAGLPQCTIEIDNVSREILAQIDAAVMRTEKITVIYRSYLSGSLTIGPENTPPLEMTISQISATPLRIRAVAGFTNLLDQRFPGLDYDLETYPGLLP
jgi:hypothetical protein